MPAPSSPTSLAVEITGRESARLTWVDGDDTDALLVYRHTADVFGSAAVVGATIAGEQVYIDSDISQGTAYYWWVKPLGSGGVGTEAGSVTGTTIGEAGNIGTNLVEQIVDAFHARLAAQFPADWHRLKYARQVEKNDKIGRNRGYACLPKSGERSKASVFGAYTITQDFDIILTKGVQPGKGDSGISEAELELYTWMDRVIRDAVTTKLYESDIVLRVQEPTLEAPEYFEDEEMVVIRASFPVTYRNNL